MKLYSFLRQHLNLKPGDSAVVVAVWYAILLFLVFIGLSQFGMDLRYANL